MQIVNILLTIVVVLALMSGFTIFAGAMKGDRARSAWFFAATIFSAFWVTSVLLIWDATPGADTGMALYHACFAFFSVLFVDAALLGYIVWHEKIGKILTIVLSFLSTALSLIVLINPRLFVSKVSLVDSVNRIEFNIGPVYCCYVILASLLTATILYFLIRRRKSARSQRIKGGSTVLLVGFLVSSLVTLVADLVITFWDWSYSWLGPLAISATIIAFYYSILRYRSLKLNSSWLRFMSYVVIIATVAILYMVVFYIVFLAMFRGSNPSTEVIILNFIMVFFFILLMPAINDTISFMSSLISGDSTKSGVVDNKINDGAETPSYREDQTVRKKG